MYLKHDTTSTLMRRANTCIGRGLIGCAFLLVSASGFAFGQDGSRSQQSKTVRENSERELVVGATRIFLDTNLHVRRGVLRGITADSVLMVEELVEGGGGGAGSVRGISRVERISRSELLAITSPIVKTPVVQAGAALALWSNPSVRRDQTAPGRLELVDGQSLPGNFWVQGSKGEVVGWDSHAFGRVGLPLETVRMMVIRPLAFAQHADARAMQESVTLGSWKQDKDAVFLMNGDRADGFLASFGQDAVIEQDGKDIILPEDRISAFALANPSAAKQGIWVWLYNGSVVCADEVILSGDDGMRGTGGSGGSGGSGGGYLQWHVPLNKQALSFGSTGTGEGELGQVDAAAVVSDQKHIRATIAHGDLRAICFDFSRVTPLATVPMANMKPLNDRRWAPPPVIGDARLAPLNAADIELAGPMEIEWPLPAGSTRLGGQIELAPSSQMWGDCEVSMELVSDANGDGVNKPLWKKRLRSQEPEHAFNIVLTPQQGATRLRMRIEASEGGPVQDRIIVRRALIVK